MGLLFDGRWVDRWYDTSASGGRFIRRQRAFLNWITPNGAAGPTGCAGFKAEPGRYHR
jgi:putative glutathione S-transferase